MRTFDRVVLGIICLASALSAQSGYANVSGRVKDASGAVMPGVSLSARNINTNAVLNVTTNGEGYYTVSNLIPVTYTLTAQAQGFRQDERDDIVLPVGDRFTIDFPMEVASVAETQ